MGAPGWPVQLSEGPVGVRPLRLRDGGAWSELRLRNREWLAPWEARVPRESWTDAGSATFPSMLRGMTRQARAGTALPLVVTVDGELAGQLTVANIVRGALQSGAVGYWVDERVAGRGVLPTALALVVDHCFAPRQRGGVGLHRIEANIRPENVASRRVVEKLGFREEGLHLRFLFIDGGYRDHLSYALTVEDVRGSLLRRWRAVREGGTRLPPSSPHPW